MQLTPSCTLTTNLCVYEYFSVWGLSSSHKVWILHAVVIQRKAPSPGDTIDNSFEVTDSEDPIATQQRFKNQTGTCLAEHRLNAPMTGESGAVVKL